MIDTLGVIAHRGGVLVDVPELRVGVVHATSRPSGLELELIARRPLDRRSALERQADIRAGRGGPPVSERRLLPASDEGDELRVGWLDDAGRAHWEYGSYESSGGDHAGGSEGPSLRTVMRLPALYDRASVVLAWPEIGFPETVVDLPLPDRATVERQSIPVSQAPLDTLPVPEPLRHYVASAVTAPVAVEAGRVVAGPRVLSRGERAVIVLTRLTEVDGHLSMAMSSFATDVEDAGLLDAQRTDVPHPSVGVVEGGDAYWYLIREGFFTGLRRSVEARVEYLLRRPDGGSLDLIVGWPAAGLFDVLVRLDLRSPE